MLSESAKVLQARESTYRIQSPNSQCRRIRVLLLGENAVRVYASLIEQDWVNLEFLLLGPVQDDFSLETLSRLPVSREAFIASADEIVVILPDDGDQRTVQRFGRFCNEQGRLITVVVNPGGGNPEECNALLGAIRPHAGMVILSDELDYAQAMLEAFHAHAID